MPVAEPIDEPLPGNMSQLYFDDETNDKDKPKARKDIPCYGKISYVKVFVDATATYSKPVMVIKLHSERNNHFTDVADIQRQLFEAMLRGMKVHLLTDSCESGNFGFAQFEMDSKDL